MTEKSNKGSGALLVGVAAIAVGASIAFAMKKPKEECVTGEVKTFTCPDGSTITTHVCVDSKWTPTGEECSVPPGNFVVTFRAENSQGNPIASAKFTMLGEEKITNSSGVVSFTVPEDTYSIIVTAPSGWLVTPEDTTSVTLTETITSNKTFTFAFREITNLLESVLVVYASTEDASAAATVQEGFQNVADVVNIVYRPSLSDIYSNNVPKYDVLAIIGGEFAWQYTNPYDIARDMWALFLPGVSAIENCVQYSEKPDGLVVYGVAGDSTADTLSLAIMLKQRLVQGDLPSSKFCL